MSEKVTFQELIDSIAEQTDNSKQFTHDFLKDLVAVINTGLNDEGKVNIAGFGKFELRRMKEREGYNPQTGNKMTIPSHNKVVFKPYKDLRELVNAPYIHLEPEIIEEEETEQEQQGADAEQETTPIIPPSGKNAEKGQEAEQEPISEEAPFPLHEDESSVQAKDQDQDEDRDDVVEFRVSDRADEESGDETDESEKPPTVLDRYLAGTEQDDKEPEEDTVDDVKKGEERSDMPTRLEETEAESPGETLEDSVSETPEKASAEEYQKEEEVEDAGEPSETEDEVAGPAEEEPETELEVVGDTFEDASPSVHDEETDEEEAQTKPGYPSSLSKRRSIPPSFWYAAAAILLILILGIWYFIPGSGGTQSPTMTATQPQQVVDEPESQPQPDMQQSQPEVSEESDQDQSAANDGEQEAPASATPAPSTSTSPVATARDTQPQDDPQEVTINRGQSLWSIARNNYQDPYLWPWIYDANKNAIGNPNLIIEGQTLAIPMPDEPDYGLSDADSLEVAIGYVTTYHWYKENGHERAKFYLWAARIYDDEVFDHISQPIDEEDLAFANRVR